MPIDSVNEKLGQAKRALQEMRAEERKTLSNYPDRFSAFLSAARSVDYRLRCEYGDKYRDWRKTWNAQHQYEDDLLKCMHDKRDEDIHARGPGLNAKTKEIKFGVGGYSDASGNFQSAGSSRALMGQDVTAGTSIQTYDLDVCGTVRPATEACDEYLTVLEKMVGDFAASP
jgi:hypothetical protein